MDQSFGYDRINTKNYGSAYNYSPYLNSTRSNNYAPLSSGSFYSNRSQSPASPKFNLDLYHPNTISYGNDQLSLGDSYRSISPASSVVVHHYPLSPTMPSSNISKLRQINDELLRTLAKCDELTSMPSYSLQAVTPQDVHVHHHPVPRRNVVQHYRSRSPSEQNSFSSVEDDFVPERRNAKITYNVRIPRSRPKSTDLTNAEKFLISSSSVYPNEDPLTVDLYPTKDHAFVPYVRNRPDNRKPWLSEQPTMTRRNSYPDMTALGSISPSPSRVNHNQDEPLLPNSRLSNPKNVERIPKRQSIFTNKMRRTRSLTAVSVIAPIWRSPGSFKGNQFLRSNSSPQRITKQKEPIWRPGGKPPTKYVRALDPGTKEPKVPKASEPIWQPSSKKIHTKTPKYFEPTLKPNTSVSITKESQVKEKKKRSSSVSKSMTLHPEYKNRMSQAESKIKSAWQKTGSPADSSQSVKRQPNKIETQSRSSTSKKPVAKPRTGLSAPPKVSAKPTTTSSDQPKRSPPTKVTTSASTRKPITNKANLSKPPTKPKPTTSENQGSTAITAPLVDTGRSSMNDGPTKPRFQSTPKDRSIQDDDDALDDMFGDESHIEVQPNGQKKETTPPVKPTKTAPIVNHEQEHSLDESYSEAADDRDKSVVQQKNNRDSINDQSANESIPTGKFPIQNKPPTPPSKSKEEIKSQNASVIDDDDDIQQIDGSKNDTLKDDDSHPPKANTKKTDQNSDAEFSFTGKRSDDEEEQKAPGKDNNDSIRKATSPSPREDAGAKDDVDDFFD